MIHLDGWLVRLFWLWMHLQFFTWRMDFSRALINGLSLDSLHELPFNQSKIVLFILLNLHAPSQYFWFLTFFLILDRLNYHHNAHCHSNGRGDNKPRDASALCFIMLASYRHILSARLSKSSRSLLDLKGLFFSSFIFTLHFFSQFHRHAFHLSGNFKQKYEGFPGYGARPGFTNQQSGCQCRNKS